MQAFAEKIDRLVRSALAHLYDYAYLQNHPLAAVIDANGDLDQVTRAQKLRRLLLDCIEALRTPEEGKPPSEEGARAYSILTYRYVDGVPIEEIAAKRGLSERQAYRELEKGVAAVGRILQDKLSSGSRYSLPTVLENSDTASDSWQTAQAEIARLRQAASSETLNLLEVLDGVLHLLAPLSERIGIQLQVSRSKPWPEIRGDRVLLRQAFLNLLTHALNAIVQGDLLLTSSAIQGYSQLDIHETPTVTRTRPLQPAPTTRTPAGLSVARSLIEAQGGHLETSHVDGRWQARIRLPAAGQTTILVIDDNADLVALFKRYLGGHEVNVVGASNAEEAMCLARERRPRLVTLDVMMPGRDGWEILQRLKEAPETKEIPVIVCSVLHEAELAQTMGASDYITKPVIQADLIATVTRWLGPLQPAG